MKKIQFITSVLSLFFSAEALAMDLIEEFRACNFTASLSYGPDEEMQFWQELSTQTGISTLPAVAIFRKNGKELRYICAQHSIYTSSPTYRLVLQTIEEFKPSCLILEGFDNEKETINSISEELLHTDLEHCGEMIYAVSLAKKNDIPLRGGEPLYQEILNSLLAHGYEEHDLIYFYFTRQIPQEFRQKKLHSEKELPDYFNVFIQQNTPLVQNDSMYTYEKYQSWITEILGEPVPFVHLIATDSMLLSANEMGHKLQKISHIVNIVRDSTVLARILESLKDYDKVLTIYGSRHYFAQYNVLHENLGDATYASCQ